MKSATMFSSHSIRFCLWTAFVIGSVTCQSRHNFNPSIIQDSRLEPKVDGTFGFFYRTEDGISHTAQADPTGYIQGSYSYKDPTGLKVNFNYFAGAKKKSARPPQPANRAQEYRNVESQYSQPDVQRQYHTREPETYQQRDEYRPRTRPPASYTRSPEYLPTYESRQTSRSSSRLNEVYDVDDYQYRG